MPKPRLLRTIKAHTDSICAIDTALNFSADSTKLVSLALPLPGTAKLWNLKRVRGKYEMERITGRGARPFSVAYSPDGESAVVSDMTLGATRLNLQSGEAVRYSERGQSAAYSPDGRLLATDGLASVIIRDSETGEELHRLDSAVEGDRSAISLHCGNLAFSPDGKYLAHVSGYRYGSERSELKVWRTRDFKKIGGGPLAHRDFAMGALIFSPDSLRLFVGTDTGSVEIWNTTDWTQKESMKVSQASIVSLAISSDGMRLVAGTIPSAVVGSSGVSIWDLETKKELHKLRSRPVGFLALSPDDRTLAVGQMDNNLVLWDVETGTRLQTIQAHSGSVLGVAFSPDGNRLATAGDRGDLHLWDAVSNDDVEQDQNTLQALFRLALWRYEQERYEEAEALFSKVVELNQQSGRPIDSELRKAKWKIRNAMLQTGKWPVVEWGSKFVGASLGGQATLSVEMNEGDWTYQWYCKYEPVEDATDATLTLSNVTADQIGTYYVKITPKGYESVASALAGDAYIYDASNPIIPGVLWCEIFYNIEGGRVEDLTSSKAYQNNRPTFYRSLPTWEAPPKKGGGFGGTDQGIRVTGYVKPPKTGDYVFYLASDDEGELYISSDESTDNLEMIASIKRGPSGVGNESGRTNRRAWGKNPSAVSKSIHLEAGKRYAIKALMKQAEMGQHLSVTWQMPGNPPPKTGDPPIPGEYLEFEVK